MKSLIGKGMLIACLFCPFILNAQNEIDALRYSQVMFGSTARTLSMGGAFGALGADFGAITVNPAGLGVYRKSEFTFTLGFNSRNVESEFLGNLESDSKFSVDLPNLSVVFASVNRKKSSEWKQFAFSLGYNRTANFNSEIYQEGKNPNNSILDSFIDELNQSGGVQPVNLFNYYPFDIDLAYQTFLINPINSDSTLYSSVIPDGNAYQSSQISTTGGMGEYSLGFGGNYNDKLYFGITLGFPTIRYEENKTIEETDKDGEIFYSDTINGNFDLRSFKYNQNLLTTGNGFNAKFGFIFRPLDWIRAGVAIHTPTWYYMSDSYNAAMSSSFADIGNYSYNSPEGTYSYRLNTPFRAIGSLAFIFGSNGLISFDYELTDYSSSKLKASDYNFSNENKIISQTYSGFASNFRGGLEWKYEKFSFRGGIAYYSTPFEKQYSSDKTDQHVISYTGGIGYRERKFYIDIGYGYATRSEYYQEYQLSNEDVPGAVRNRTEHRVLTTFGFRF